MRQRAVLLGAVLVLGACADLPEVEPEGCGNLVLNADEDCDGFSAFGGDTACGAPDTANACHYVCEGGASCPSGWGCGRDGRCSPPGGRFAPANGSPWRFRVGAFAIGDVDGDGANDLIGNDVATITIRFGSGDGEFAREVDLLTRQPQGPVAFGHFDEGDTLDAVVPIAGGLFALRGEPGGLDPVAYAPFDIPPATSLRVLPVQGWDGNVDDELLFIYGNKMMVDASGAETAMPATFEMTQIAGTIPVGDLDGDGLDELALAFTGASKLYLYEVSGLTEKTVAVKPYPSALAHELELPSGTTVRSGARFADVDGDGDLDLLVSVTGPAGKHRVLLAFNDGVGHLGALQPVPVFDGLEIAPWPLAAADLDGDGMADYVFPQAIVLAARQQAASGPPDRLVPVTFNFVQPWIEAVVGDFNGDGRPDVATALEGIDGVDFFLNTGGGLFNRFHVDTDRPPRDLRVGDFDGDFLHDVAFAELGFFDEPDELSVIFGAPAGGPSSPVGMGSLGFIESMEPASKVLSLEGLDSMTDLVVISASFPARDSRSAAILQGSSSRRMISPFTLQVPGEDPDVPRWALVGHFTGDAARDVVVVADEATDVFGGPSGADVTRLWLVPGQGPSAGLDAAAATFIEMPDRDTFDHRCAIFAAGDLDGAGPGAARDEIIAIDNGDACYGGGFSPPPRLLVGRVDAEGQLVLSDPVELPGGYTVIRQLTLRDLDGDGDDDVLAVFAGEHRTGEPTGAAVVAIWNFDGELSLDTITVLTPPGTRRLRGVAPLQLDDDAPPELVILDSTGLFATDMDLVTKQYSTPQPLRQRSGDGRLVTGDLDGDGLDDIAFTDGTEVHVLLQERAPPLGAAAEVVPAPTGADAGGQP